MKLTHYGNLTQLTFLPGFFPVNCYFVQEEDGLTLIDAALPWSAKPILEAAQRLGKPIVRIALTHAHGDHVGALDALHAALPHAEVSISARDVRLLSGDQTLDANEPQVTIKGSKPQCQTTPSRLLSAGDKVGSLEVVACPGHTPGHIAFLDTRDKTLIAGDAFQTRTGIAVAGVVKPFFPFPAMGTWHKHTSLASAKHLLTHTPTKLAVGHGPVLRDPVSPMDKAIRVAERAFQGRS
jgi:glyoxylase-like metal-dependent hydrolase (beta-lactamase superfamily II)